MLEQAASDKITLPFTTEFAPRFSETDAVGHIGNTAIPVWFEESRAPIFNIIHPSMTLHDWPIIVAHLEVDFLRQIFIGKTVTVNCGISRIGGKSFTVYHEAWQNGEKVATSSVVCVYFDYDKQSTVTIPDKVREQLLEMQR